MLHFSSVNMTSQTFLVGLVLLTRHLAISRNSGPLRVNLGVL